MLFLHMHIHIYNTMKFNPAFNMVFAQKLYNKRHTQQPNTIIKGETNQEGSTGN